MSYTKTEFKDALVSTLKHEFNTTPEKASNDLFYRACAQIVKQMMHQKRQDFISEKTSHGAKRVYYLSMEFLMGRSLKNSIYNLGIDKQVIGVLKDFDVDIEEIYACEPDAGLGNGGLGRLAACYLDSLAALEIPATGYSICYEFGIFRQKLVNGWQTELADDWLPGGEVWLERRDDRAAEVHFGGEIEESWDNSYHSLRHKNYTTVKAVPYDMFVSGYGSKGVSLLRLYKSENPGIDMELFNQGDYKRALSLNSDAAAISKILYPNDNHAHGKMLRLKQQYFLVSASVQDIVATHLETYSTLANLDEKIAIHINDTHPALAVPELMRILLDECGYSWDEAFRITKGVFAYTNHTVMREALEVWDEDMFRELLPRIYQITKEINERFCKEAYEKCGDLQKVERMAIVSNHKVRMANLSVIASHNVNGVSALHSQILKDSLFNDFYTLENEKFLNVTNGIASRRWLYQSNPALTKLIKELIGPSFINDQKKLEGLMKFADDEAALKKWADAKHECKERLAKYVKNKSGVVIDTSSVFDVQVKRLHEYKRQHMNALDIISTYLYLKNNPNAVIVPRTYIFGAKAAPGYFMAKRIIKLIYEISREIEKDARISSMMKVVYLEDYNVTLSELIMPAAEISEQISLAGTEASGTGNMKFMLNGAITLGTMDGANIEISEQVGMDNILIFGMRSHEVDALRACGYSPKAVLDQNANLRDIIALLKNGINGEKFEDIANMLSSTDYYMALADFNSYSSCRANAFETYKDLNKWQKMSMINTAKSHFFSADRSISEYAQNIWHI